MRDFFQKGQKYNCSTSVYIIKIMVKRHLRYCSIFQGFLPPSIERQIHRDYGYRWGLYVYLFCYDLYGRIAKAERQTGRFFVTQKASASICPSLSKVTIIARPNILKIKLINEKVKNILFHEVFLSQPTTIS